MAYECVYCNVPLVNGTGKSAHERFCKQNPNHIVTKRERRNLEREANPNNRCPECEAAGTPRGFDGPGALMHHRVKAHDFENPAHKKASTEVVVNGNGHSPAQIRRSLQAQHRNRSDLTHVIQVVFPDGIPTKDTQALDESLEYIFQTGRMLERRP